MIDGSALSMVRAAVTSIDEWRSVGGCAIGMTDRRLGRYWHRLLFCQFCGFLLTIIVSNKQTTQQILIDSSTAFFRNFKFELSKPLQK